MSGYKIRPGAVIPATIGQYSDFLSLSDFTPKCLCGSTATRADGLCDGCGFRRTVMEAAGREDEFWDARGGKNPGWSYKIRYVSNRPGSSLRLRNIQAPYTENIDPDKNV